MDKKAYGKNKKTAAHRIKGQVFRPSNRKRVEGKRGSGTAGKSEIESLLAEQTQSAHFHAFRKNLPQNQSPKDLFLKVIRAFNKHRIPYLVIGGLAVRKYDRARKTEDLDMFVRPDTNTLRKTIEVLKKLKYSECFYFDLLEQSWTTIGAVKNVGVHTLKNHDTVRFLGLYPLDLMIASDAPDSKKYFDEMLKNALETDVFGEKLSVIHIQDLISSKLKSIRPKDVADKWRLVKILKDAQKLIK